MMNPCELTLLITAAANRLAAQYTDAQLALIAAVLTQLGDTLATIIVQRELQEECRSQAEGAGQAGCD